MSKPKERDAVKAAAEAQARTAAAQEATGQRFLGYADEDRSTQAGLSRLIQPAAERLISGADLAGIARPDVSGQIRRDYGDETAEIEAESARAMGEAADYNVGSGAARTGSAGTGGLPGIFRGRTLARSANRRAMQQALTGEQLAGYEDQLRRSNMGLDRLRTGTGLLERQQAVFDPARTAAIGTGSTAQSVASRTAEAANQQAVARMPTRWSKVGGAIGAGLNIASAFTPVGAAGKAVKAVRAASSVLTPRPALSFR